MTERPCGCDTRWPCNCAPAGLTERGTFARSCRACRITYEGRRHEVVQEHWEHVRTDEHRATWAREADRIHAEDDERERLEAGQLW